MRKNRNIIYLILAAILLTISSTERLLNPIGRNNEFNKLIIISVLFFSIICNAFFLFLLKNLTCSLSYGGQNFVLIFFFVIVTFLFLYVYPKYGATVSVNSYGDRDDALKIISEQILNHSNPYRFHTYLGDGQVPSPTLNTSLIYLFPTAFGIAPGYMNIFLLGLTILLTIYTQMQHESISILGIAMINPSFLEDFLFGGDFFVYPIFLLIMLNSLTKVNRAVIFSVWAFFFIPISGNRSTQLIFLTLWFFYVLGNEIKYKVIHLFLIFLSTFLIILSGYLNKIAGVRQFTYYLSTLDLFLCGFILALVVSGFILFNYFIKIPVEKYEMFLIFLSICGLSLIPGIIFRIHLWGHIWPFSIFGIYILYKKYSGQLIGRI